MRASFFKAVGLAVAATFVFCLPTKPASAGGCADPYSCWPGARVQYWPAPYPNENWSDWRGLFSDVRGGSLVRAALGTYPYNQHGYNSGHCIGYQIVCDPSGRVIGRRPIVVC
jgi:hypothetical protein